MGRRDMIEPHITSLFFAPIKVYVGWYERRGLQALGAEPILYEGVQYTPMELSIPAAEKLLAYTE